MTQKPLSPYRSVGTKDHFLVSSSDTSDPAVETGKDTAALEKEPDRDILMREYPQLQTGKLWVALTLQKLSDCERFGAMVLRKDPYEDQAEAPLCLIIAGVIDTLCTLESGWWGLIDPDLFACLLPNKNNMECSAIGQKLQSSLREKTTGTVTIGIAAFPTEGFDQKDILDNACKALDHAAFFGPGSQVLFDDTSLNISADQLFQKGDIPAAIEEFSKALLIGPANVNVRNSLGVCHSLLGNFESATAEFKIALELAPEEFMAQYNLGLVQMLNGNREEALALFLEADRLSGGEVFEVALQTGRLYLEIEQPEKALFYLEKALQFNPTSTAYRLIGDCYSRLNRTDDAITAYNKAIKQNPNDAAALSSLGLIYATRGENPEIATVFCEKSVEISPEEGLYRHRLGELYLLHNQPEEALEAFQTAIKFGYDSARFIEEIENRKASPACISSTGD